MLKLMPLLLLLSFNSFASEEISDVACRIKQIEDKHNVVCEKINDGFALCLTLECSAREVYRCGGETKDFKVKVKYYIRKSTDQAGQYQVEPIVQIRKVKFKPQEFSFKIKDCK